MSTYLPAYSVVEQSPEQFTVAITVHAECPAFVGHFPEFPVLPGISQLDWAVQIAQQLWPQLPANTTGVEQLKFQQLTRPNTALTLTLQWQPERYKLQFHYSSTTGSHSQGSILFSHDS